MKAIRVAAGDLAEVGTVIPDADRAEMAVPSYTHWNPLIRWLFWKRLDAAVALSQLREGMRVLDFGVGTGILFRTLMRARVARIAGVDVLLGPAREMAKKLNLSPELIEASEFERWAKTQSASFDRIFALDVLEHVGESELSRLSETFSSLLAPGGALVVSGPTESFAYKVGRALAGFRGDYHHRNIFDINQELGRLWVAETQSRLPTWPLPQAFVLTRFARRTD